MVVCMSVLYEVQIPSTIISFGHSVIVFVYGGIFTMQSWHRACYDFRMISMLCHMQHSCQKAQPWRDIVTFSTVLLSRCP